MSYNPVSYSPVTYNPVSYSPVTCDPVTRPGAQRGADSPTTPPTRAGLIGRFLRGRHDDPAWVRPALLGLLAATAVLYIWGLGASGWANSFYTAAVQAGTKSWKAFFFGSFDPSNFITVDKSPAALWVMEISGRIFGFNSWSMLIPEALEGVATVGLVYLTVRRWFPPAAAIAAGLVVTVTPVAALMFRFNNPDALMVMLVTLAAYATVRAVDDGRARWMVLAGSAIGFGFLAKMLEAFLVVPALALVVLVAGQGPLLRRVRLLLYGGAALLVAAGWWVLAVQLTPAADRPYVGGSQDNSLWNLMFGYNGFGRLTGNETGSVGGGAAGTGGRWGATGLTRLFGSEMGTQISWLLPAALVLLVAGLVVTRRSTRTNRTRAGLLLWGGWLVVAGLSLSLGQGIIHPYYTVALAPAIGGLIGVGGVLMWANRDRWAARAVLAAAVALTAGWSAVLLGRTPGWLPWLRPLVLSVGLLSALALLTWPWIGRSLRPVVAALAVLACLAAPAAYTLDTVDTPHSGAIPTAGPAGSSTAAGPGGGPGFPGRASPGGAFPASRSRQSQAPGGFAGGFPAGRSGGNRTAVNSPAGGGGGAGGLLQASRPSAAMVSLLEKDASRYTWVAATVGANDAAGYQLTTGDAVMAIGGFNGTDPYPTLAYFEKLVGEGKVHYFIAGGGFAGGGGPGGGPGSRRGPGGGFGGGFGGPGGAVGPGPVGGGATASGTTASVSSAITSWVESHYTAETVGGVTVYDLTAPAT